MKYQQSIFHLLFAVQVTQLPYGVSACSLPEGDGDAIHLKQCSDLDDQDCGEPYPCEVSEYDGICIEATRIDCGAIDAAQHCIQPCSWSFGTLTCEMKMKIFSADDDDATSIFSAY